MLIILFLAGCLIRSKEWKTINLQNYGSVKVPAGWTYHIYEDEIYFVDEGTNDIKEENIHLGGYIYRKDEEVVESKVFPEIKIMENTKKSEVYSNDTYVGINRYYINEKWCEKSYIKIGISEQETEVFMITWDDTVSYDDLKKIAKSFKKNI